MTRNKELPVPLKRFTDAYGIGVKPCKGFSRWIRDRRWNNAYSEAKEHELSPTAIQLIDVFNAFMTTTTFSVKGRVVSYLRVATVLRYLDEETIKMWFDGLVKEYQSVDSSDDSNFKERWKNAYLFHRFCYENRINTYESIYWSPQDAVVNLYNMVRIAAPRDKYRDKPLAFDRQNRELLYPHYDLSEKLSDREVLEVKGILQLQNAWRTRNEEEKQKLGRFVVAYVDQIPAVISLLESRYVDTLEELDSLMKQTGDTPALSQGAL